ncbi:alpha/beta fold hydrolase [Nocardioides sp.]|uniref:alpha/beta fold hydrolase n=1 Tax=Nocardioides sp. TaxID=35761 RepID=UPI0035166E01
MSQTKTSRHGAPATYLRAGQIGRGEPVLLIHPFTTSRHVWDEVVPGLTDRYDVVAPTLAGHWGGPQVRRRDVSLRTYADGLEAVLDELGWETAHLVGNSIGGWLSFELARRGRARSITAIAPAGSWDRFSLAKLEIATRFLAIYPFALLGHALDARVLSSLPVRRGALAIVSRRTGRVSKEQGAAFVAASTHCPSFFPFLVSELHQDADHLDVAGLDEQVPVRLVLCEHDRILPVARFGEPYVRALPHADVVRLPGVGHIPMFEDPELVVDVVREHLDAVTARGASLPGRARRSRSA